MNLFRVANGRIVEIWSAFNSLSVLQQLGAIPHLGPLHPSVSGHRPDDVARLERHARDAAVA